MLCKPRIDAPGAPRHFIVRGIEIRKVFLSVIGCERAGTFNDRNVKKPVLTQTVVSLSVQHGERIAGEDGNSLVNDKTYNLKFLRFRTIENQIHGRSY